jgi:hypothetical protein
MLTQLPLEAASLDGHLPSTTRLCPFARIDWNSFTEPERAEDRGALSAHAVTETDAWRNSASMERRSI